MPSRRERTVHAHPLVGVAILYSAHNASTGDFKPAWWRRTSRLRRSVWLTLLFGVALLSSSCTPWKEYFRNGFKVGPNFLRPPAPVASKWIDAADARVKSETGDLSRWWTVFNDPVLNSLVDSAYRQNLTLKDAGFRVLQTRAQFGIARGNFFPQTQTANGDYFRQGLSRNAANRGYIGQRFFDQHDLGFTLAWEVDFWGLFRRTIEYAGETMNASVENYDAVLVTLIGDVATTYVQIRTLERQIELTRQNAALQRETLVLATARFQGGTTTDLDVEQARTVVGQTEAEIPLLEISLRQANNHLCVLLGIPPEDLHQQLGTGEIPVAPPSVIAGIPADLLRRRPDVRQAERLAAAQSAQIGIAEAQFYPHISLTGTLDYQSQSLRNLISPGSFQGTVGPTYTWNILNYFRILNNVRYQDALFKQLVVDYQNTVLTAAQETENGMVTFVKSWDQAATLYDSVVAAQTAVIIAIAQYRGGMVDFNRVALLETTLVNQQNLLAQARGQIATGLIDVYRALGGGWELRVAAPTSDESAAEQRRLPPTKPAPPNPRQKEPEQLPALPEQLPALKPGARS
jgi:NodT family efflux transporter outer membrane factor (OMF) lipoprotein